MGFFADKADKATGSGVSLPPDCGVVELELVGPIQIRASANPKKKGAYIMTAQVKVVRTISPGSVTALPDAVYTLLQSLPAAETSQGPGLDNIFRIIEAFSDAPASIATGSKEMNTWCAQQADLAMSQGCGRVGKRRKCTVTSSASKEGTVFARLTFDYSAAAPVQQINTQGSTTARVSASQPNQVQPPASQWDDL